ncbi:MAG: ATP phosphoribosyltransferase regulatory subunit, partial [Sedimentisphaerales bacterium]|nr:ATP phosphoribosyltransferase regulatory subunit [Sedimentisphaerales bacterium]
IREVVKTNDEVEDALNKQAELFDYLDLMGVSRYCEFDPAIVRGLAYYTGVVYEIYDRDNQLRAIGGGGRYDNLLKQFGGPDMPATGFGIGDCVLGILLQEKGLLQKQLPLHKLDFFIACVEEVYRKAAVELTMRLRSAGCTASFSYKAAKLSKQLKEASTQNAKKCIIIGEEFNNNQLVVKDMATGEQKTIEVDRFFAELKPLVSARLRQAPP